jgi:hypothetical protein
MTYTSDTPIQQKKRELFWRTPGEGEDDGYPDRVTFVASDEDWADASVWHALHAERRAAVVVDLERETLLVSRRRNSLLHRLDALVGRAPALVSSRTHGTDAFGPAVRTRVRRPPGEQIPPLPRSLLSDLESCRTNGA